MAKKSIRARAMAGESVLGAMVFEFFSPGVAQCLQLAGAEYIIYDMEHTGLGYETLKTQVAHCRGLDVVPMARVPRSDYAFISRALDVGAQGIMVPMVNSVEEARAIAEATRYPPDGRRGAAFGFAHDDYQAGSPIDKIKAANENSLLLAQIEPELGRPLTISGDIIVGFPTETDEDFAKTVDLVSRSRYKHRHPGRIVVVGHSETRAEISLLKPGHCDKRCPADC